MTTSQGGVEGVAEDKASEARSPWLSTKAALFLALASGVLGGLSHPLVIKALGSGPVDPTGLTGLLALVAAVPLLMATEGRGIARAFGLAFLAAWVHFVIVGHWLVVAFSHFGGLPFAAGTAAMLLVTAGIGLFPALAIPAANLIERELGFSRWWVFALTLAAAELLRDFLPFQGVPWGQAGVALGTVSVIAQSAAVVGVYGLVAFAGLINGVIAHVVTAKLRGREVAKHPLVVAAATVGIVLAYGALRLQTAPIPEGTATVKVGLLQASIEQNTLNKGGKAVSAKIRGIYHDLQDEAVAKGAELVVWPEAALRPGARGNIDDLSRAGALRREVFNQGEQARKDAAPKAAIVGAVSTFEIPDVETGRIRRGLYTSAFATTEGFKVVGRWDKVNLLPFGEFIPFPLHSLITAFVKVGGNLVLGEDHRVVEMPIAGREVKVGTTICYEGVFPGVTRKLANNGAELLVNITNDAWYGTSSEMPQHLVHYRLRAIESGRAVARAANSGISAWIDSRGRVHAATKRDEKVVVVVDVPLFDETPPVRFLGDWLALLALLFTVVASWMALFGRSLKSAQLAALKTPAAALAVATLPLLLGCFAVSAWAPVNEGIRTLCDATAAMLVLGAFALRSERSAIHWVALSASVGVTILGILGMLSIHVAAVGFSLVGVGAAVALVLQRRR